MEQSKGVVVEVNYDQKSIQIRLEDESSVWIRFDRIKNSPFHHGCLARVGDEMFVRDEGKLIALFVTPPEAVQFKEEVSRVTNISNLIFGERVVPDCGCSISLGLPSENQHLQVGMLVRHNLGFDQTRRPMGTNLRIEPETAEESYGAETELQRKND